MSQNNESLRLLRFELDFLNDGGYGRSPHASWRPSLIFEDSPTCLNFNDKGRTRPCSECSLLQFVPSGKREEAAPCRFIPLTEKQETVEDFYRFGTQVEMEEALKRWLQKEIERMNVSQG